MRYSPRSPNPGKLVLDFRYLAASDSPGFDLRFLLERLRAQQTQELVSLLGKRDAFASAGGPGGVGISPLCGSLASLRGFCRITLAQADPARAVELCCRH